MRILMTLTELCNENNTLPKCELDQWLENYLEEMELQQLQQQQEQKQQSQQLSDEKNNISLLNMCQYSDISSVDYEISPSLGQCEENKDEDYYEQDDHEDNF